MGTSIFNQTLIGTGRALLTALMAALLLAGLAGAAAAQTVAVTPQRKQVTATRSHTVQFTYVLTNLSVDGPATVTSPVGSLFFSGQNGSGSHPLPPLPPTVVPAAGNAGPGTATIRETVFVPHSVILQALQAGTRTIFLTREFIFDYGVFGGPVGFTVEGIPIDITGSLGGPLTVSRLDLRFYNNAVQIIVPQHEPPQVRVDISYSGTGLFRAVWEVADPRTTVGGAPIYRILRQDRVRLPVGGFTSVKGPPLPADLTGPHVVRFRVLDGPLQGEAPVVRYFVKAADPGEEWWKRYLRPHTPETGFIRVPGETDTPGMADDESPAATSGPEAPDAAEPEAGEPDDAEPAGDEAPEDAGEAENGGEAEPPSNP